MYKQLIVLAILTITGCNTSETTNDINIETSKHETTLKEYWDYQDNEMIYNGGIKMIPITTPKGEFKVWTKTIGNNPTKKVLLLHGGPGMTHEIYECFNSWIPKEGIEIIYYDQLGSYYSDQPSDTSLWNVKRFVDEVEQVRVALDLNKDNFYLFGQSWGGILAMEYTLKHQINLKGLIISNMMASIPEYNNYAHEVLGPQLPADVLQEIMNIEKNQDFENPRYAELLMNHHYTQHVLRKPINQWPEAVNRALKHLNPEIYVYMQGYSEFGISGDATLKNWDRSDDISDIKVPTLVIGSKHDTMDPKHMEWMASEIPFADFLLCPQGSHLSQYDDQKTFFEGLIQFINTVDSDEFQKM
ncbi:proline iminopeptidase-family hydrolase [Marinigracilibium pacificum]|uniref:Proline iminopeptidase-family hydrolase n=1 Tax=Marinigracilibium pacificum TaxID=2729599 RepID=A0A848J2S9_9BACT|nr:proline iminopeptidase-family hydrolase [Marinigracilibium pacificum]NMM47482.1 proline iminopeptidase-family hydrolase [Marinigracilibium pacificum]